MSKNNNHTLNQEIVLRRASIAVGVIADLVAILGWLGLTPETIGEPAYRVLNMLGPFLIAAISFFLGWQFCTRVLFNKKKEEQEERKREIDRFRDRLFELPDRYKSILFEAVENEVVVTSGNDNIAAESLEKDGLLTRLDTESASGRYWKASKLAHNTIHREDHCLWTDFRDAPRR